MNKIQMRIDELERDLKNSIPGSEDEKLIRAKIEVLQQQLADAPPANTHELQAARTEYDLLSKQLHQLRMDRIIETDTLVKFKQDQQIEQLENTQRLLEEKIRRLENALS